MFEWRFDKVVDAAKKTAQMAMPKRDIQTNQGEFMSPLYFKGIPPPMLRCPPLSGLRATTDSSRLATSFSKSTEA